MSKIPTVTLGKAFQKTLMPETVVPTSAPTVKLGKAFQSPYVKDAQPSVRLPFQDKSPIPSRVVVKPQLAPNATSTNAPSVNLRKTELQNKINSGPALGESFIAPYNKFEEIVQKVEDGNQALQNMQAGLAMGSYSPNLAVSTGSTKLGNKLRPISKGSDFVEKGLWITDAARAVADPEYRKEADKGMGRLVDSDLEGSALFLQALSYAAQRPIAFGGAALRGRENGIDSEKQQALEELSKILDAEAGKKKEDIKSRVLMKGWKSLEKPMSIEDYKMLDAAKKAFGQ